MHFWSSPFPDVSDRRRLSFFSRPSRSYRAAAGVRAPFVSFQNFPALPRSGGYTGTGAPFTGARVHSRPCSINPGAPASLLLGWRSPELCFRCSELSASAPWIVNYTSSERPLHVIRLPLVGPQAHRTPLWITGRTPLPGCSPALC